MKEVILLKYWRGYLTAGILALITVGLTQIAKRFSTLVDMVYPYVTRFIQGFLSTWTSGVDFPVWQVLVVVLGIGLVTTLVLTIVFKWNFFQWLGWVLAGVSMIWLLHTGIYGLNYYAGPLADDVRLNVTELTGEDMEEATIYFRDKANELAEKLAREQNGDLIFSDFDTLANQAGDGFKALTFAPAGTVSGSVFAGSTEPVKKLGWADMYTSMGICGVTMPLTGEAAVNPQIPSMSMPFTMCHEMAHRMCIALEDDANFAAFLACLYNESDEFQYSAYYMAYRYCYSAMVNSGDPKDAAAAARIHSEANIFLKYDLREYDKFFTSNRSEVASNIASAANDTYIKVSGDEAGVASYGNVATLLVNWYVQELVLPFETPEDGDVFDPADKEQVDVSDILPGEEVKP